MLLYNSHQLLNKITGKVNIPPTNFSLLISMELAVAHKQTNKQTNAQGLHPRVPKHWIFQLNIKPSNPSLKLSFLMTPVHTLSCRMNLALCVKPVLPRRMRRTKQECHFSRNTVCWFVTHTAFIQTEENMKRTLPALWCWAIMSRNSGPEQQKISEPIFLQLVISQMRWFWWSIVKGLLIPLKFLLS